MQPAVFVANDYIVGPLRSGLEEQTQADGGFGEIERTRGRRCPPGAPPAGKELKSRLWDVWAMWWFRRSGCAG